MPLLRKAKPKIKFKRNEITFLLLGLLLILILVLLFRSNLMLINQVSVEPGKTFCTTEEAVKSEAKLEGQQIFLINSSSISERIKKRFICIESVQLERIPLDKVKIKLTERKPAAKVNVILQPNLENLKIQEASPSSESGRLDFSVDESRISLQLLVDKLSFIFADNSDLAKEYFKDVSSIPEFFVISQAEKKGEFIRNKSTSAVLEILPKINALQVPVDRVKIDQNKILISGDPDLVFSTDKDLNRQLASLQLILQKATMNSTDPLKKREENKPIELIDLRFDKPIVVYSKTN